MNYKKLLANKHALMFVLLAFSLNSLVSQSSIKASTFGYSSSNATSALKKALNSNYSKIIVDYQSGGWNIEPIRLFDLKDKEIVFESGVILKAIKGKFNASGASLLDLVRAKNVIITGYGATFKMNRSELQNYDSRTEHRHNLQITGGDGITVKGLTLDESGGDGIYISGSNASSYAKNIVLEDLKVFNHSRDAISIISVDKLIVKNCIFSGTKGNILGCGINFEPNNSDERLTNITFNNCTIKDNQLYGIQVSLFNMQSSSVPIGIKFENSTLTNNSLGKKDSEIKLSVGSSFKNAVEGMFTLQNVLVENVSHAVVISRKPSTAFKAKFIDCTFKNVASKTSAIYLETPSYSISSPPLGGFEFDNVKISSSSSDPFFKIQGWKTMDGLKDVTGDFVIANPNLNNDNAIYYKSVSKFSNVSLDFKLVSSLSSNSSGSTGSTGDSDNTGESSSSEESSEPTTSTSDSCVKILSVTKTISSPTLLQASSTLNASSEITHSSGLVEYVASDRIILKPGFEMSADGEAVFKASLGDCSNSSSSTNKSTALKAKTGMYYNWSPNIEIDEVVFDKPMLYPNPIISMASLEFDLEMEDTVSINIYDMNNQMVQPVVYEEKLQAGHHQLELNMSRLKTGIYFVSIESSLEKRVVKAIKR